MPTAPHSLLTLIKEMPIVNPPADKARSPKRQDLGRYCAAERCGKSRDIEAMHHDEIVMIMSIRYMVLEHTR